MTEKLKLKITAVEDEVTQDGVLIYKMTLQSKRGTYTKAVAASVWEDERGQRSVKKSWLKDIGEIEAEKKISESKTEEELKTETKAKIKDIKDTVIEEDE